MDIETRREIVKNAVRWVENILVEVLSNHGEHIGDARPYLREAIYKLEATAAAIRKESEMDEHTNES